MPSGHPAMHLSFALRTTKAFLRTLGGKYRLDLPVWLFLIVTFGAIVSCGSSSARSPFVDREAGAPDAGDDGGHVAPLPTAELDSAPPDVPGEWGGPCIDDGTCSDAIDCTEDTCDQERGRCHFT